MEKKKINYGGIIAILIIVVLFLPIIIDYFKSRKLTELSIPELKEKLGKDESFLLYIGEPDKKINKQLVKIRDFSKNDYAYDYGVYYVESSNDVSEIIGADTKVAFVIEGDIQVVYPKYNSSVISEYADIYLNANITEKNKSYKVVDSFNEYKKIVKSDEVTMSVFGRNSCGYCNLFKVVYNALAKKYDYSVYYFDSDSYDKNEYIKIINMDLTVPGKCESNGNEFKLSDGFGTPLTIFTQNGKIIDCISGYVNRKGLMEKLTSLKMISE